MSDTDDTDLLLLIPPDFFLVHSPDLDDSDSDCEFNLGLYAEEVKDTVVSDLITHVNDLESRICMIENLDRSNHCSTCNDDSFVNYSVNSLTESDIFRVQTNVKNGSSVRESLDRSHMVQSSEHKIEGNPKLDLAFKNQLSIPEVQTNSSNLGFGETNITESTSNEPRGNNDCGKYIEIHKGEMQAAEVGLNDQDTHLTTYQRKLITEVDSFLENKRSRPGKLTHLYMTANNHNVEPRSNSQDRLKNGDTGVVIDDLTASENVSDTNISKSLALPGVYELLKEMEATQNEMEDKLKHHQSQNLINHRSNDGTVDSCQTTDYGKRYGPKALDLKDLYSSPSKPISHINKQTENEICKLKNIPGNENLTSDSIRFTSNLNPQVNYVFSENSSQNEDKILRRTQHYKSLSPSRSLANYNPIDIVKANLHRRGSPNRSKSNFRRHLNFDHATNPLASKSRSSSYIENSPRVHKETKQKSDSDRSGMEFLHKTATVEQINSGPSQNIDEKFNSLLMQRTVTDKVDQNIAFDLTKPKSSETLHKKISSNNLLSLSELWNKEPTFYSDDPNKLRQKLEEERYRRQHCEQQIQVLQLRVLEEQEKLAVAIKVDQEKDRAILQITESWRKLNDHWSELEEQRHSLALQLQTEKELSKTKSDELTKKIERWEKEVSQALDLAAGYKEKSETVQQQMDLLKQENNEKLLEANNHIQNLKEKNRNYENENNKLLKQLKDTQEKMIEEEDLLSKLKVELEKSKKQISAYEADINVLKEQKDSLVSKIKDEKNRSSILEQQKHSLQQSLTEATKKEKAAQDELRLNNERIEVARTELRAFYQSQLETVVKEKLNEFQGQLEAAETALKSELQTKEKQWADKANQHYRQLFEKHKGELHQLEISHMGEINKWKEKLKESERLRNIVEKKLQEETDRRSDIAHRLHSVMETQWREALNIISNPMQGLYEVQKDENQSRYPSNHQQDSDRSKGSGDLRVSRTNSTVSVAQTEEAPFCREGMVTCRTSQPSQDHQLKKYIQMLLERGPISNQDSLLQDSLDQTIPHGNNLLSNKWTTDGTKKSAEQNFLSKPPWK